MDSNLVIGRNAVMELLSSGKEIEKIFIQTGLRGDFEKELRKELKGRDIPVQYVPTQKLGKMTRGNHQGIIAMISLVAYQSTLDVITLLYEQGKTPLVVILDGVTDVRNFGAIVRSAEIFGVHAIICPIKNSAIINEITVKASAGALAHMTICREKSIANTIELLQSMGLAIYAAEHHSEKTVDQIDFTIPCALVMGDEGEGVSAHVLKQTTERFKINQVGKTESLNVSVAAGVVLYEACKSRLTT